ncbi:MAG: radical SAM family heme chaperone HemW [Candidatus Omnitrophica bacterium]|nr:radical SAM family heme chaperone HemW [Candidatus Omnitrophota bacterium]MCM8824309.1 radical SAM family heme chaperone HemW [Candidatus Omnitrophota bacterium]MCM8826487.1 radical SAM family heme chaperone HemW [Candidatus Omnitrophota bacterium]
MSYGLYIHIPFCRAKCPYCDFYSLPYDNSLAQIYIDILSKEIEKINIEIDTVYIGGGTPTVLPRELLERLFFSLRKILDRAGEITVEVNPESIDEDKLLLFRDYKVNRLSLGLQSLEESKLKFLGRLHTVKEALQGVEDIQRLGFNNISVDLIYGLPKEKCDDWCKELANVVELPLTHISCYSLTCEYKTKFYRFRKMIDEGEVAKMYTFNINFLPKRGFYHYEVSNFSRKGFVCKHNLKYWMGGEYLGLGPSAVSFINKERKKNISNIEEYIKMCKKGKEPIAYRERLLSKKRAKELASLKIRTKEGILLDEFKELTNFDFFSIEEYRKIISLKDIGLLKLYERNGKIYRLSLTNKGFLFSDEVSSCLV